MGPTTIGRYMLAALRQRYQAFELFHLERMPVIWQHGNCAAPPLVRDENLRRIRKAGRKRWKQESGYHRRSLAETAMFRFKTIFG